jgi:hypothetical protein
LLDEQTCHQYTALVSCTLLPSLGRRSAFIANVGMFREEGINV